MPRPADQGQRPARLGDVGRSGTGPVSRAMISRPVGRVRRVAVEELDAEPHQVLRQPLDQRRRRRRRPGLLGDDHLLGRPDERQPAGQRLVEHHADAVPVARRRDRQPGRLLRRHVGHGPDDLPVASSGAAPRLSRSAVRPKSSRTTRPSGVTRTFGRLDVPVQLARLVQRLDPLGQLPQRVAEPVLVEVSGGRQRIGPSAGSAGLAAPVAGLRPPRRRPDAPRAVATGRS